MANQEGRRATQVNVCRNKGEWCYAVWVDGEFDHADMLDVTDGAGEADALAQAASEFDGAEIRRVADTNVS